LPDDLDEQQLDELLFPARPLRTAPQARPGIDFTQLHSQLQAYKHLTLQLLWEEYRETHPDGYGYSRYVAAVFMFRNRLNAMTDARSVDIDAT
jgi:transposase